MNVCERMKNKKVSDRIQSDDNTAEKSVDAASSCSRCEWREDDDGNWWTECDRAFTFYVSGPHGNGFGFCPYCGKPIAAKVFSENRGNSNISAK